LATEEELPKIGSALDTMCTSPSTTDHHRRTRTAHDRYRRDVGDRWNIYYPPGVDSAEDLPGLRIA
jgi:hypothetical protein